LYNNNLFKWFNAFFIFFIEIYNIKLWTKLDTLQTAQNALAHPKEVKSLHIIASFVDIRDDEIHGPGSNN
jgi:hypothetical protein